MADQLAYPDETVDDNSTGQTGQWFLFDPSLGSNEPHEVLSDGVDSTYMFSDGNWTGTQPSFTVHVQTKAGKLPLRRPYMGAQRFKLVIRYRTAGPSTFSTEPRFVVVDYCRDFATYTPSGDVGSPVRPLNPTTTPPGQHTLAQLKSLGALGRRKDLASFQLSNQIVYGSIQTLTLDLDPDLLKGHDPYGWGDTGDLGVQVFAPTVQSGGVCQFRLLECHVIVDEVEMHESIQADWRVRRLTGGVGVELIDVKGNWSGVPGQTFSDMFESPGNPYNNASGQSYAENMRRAIVDGGRRAGLTKAISGTAIVEADPNTYSGSLSNVQEQPNAFGVSIGYQESSPGVPKSQFIYWRSGTPSSPGGLVPVDGLIIRSTVVPDAYRDGNDRLCMSTIGLSEWDYEGTVVEHGRLSFYGLRLWCSSGSACIYGGAPGGIPEADTILDLCDVQFTGTPKGTQAPFSEFKWGMRIPAMRHDFRKVVYGRSGEHCEYTTTPCGDSQWHLNENTNAASFYPKYTTAAPQPWLPNSFHQHVSRTNSCGGSATPWGAGTHVWEECTGRSGSVSAHFKVVHSLGTIISRRCTSDAFGSAGVNNGIQYTIEHFNVIAQNVPAGPHGLDYSLGTFDNYLETACVVAGGNGNTPATPALPYPRRIPGNGPMVHAFTKVVVEDFNCIGQHNSTPVSIAGAREVILDRGRNPSGKTPFFGMWEWATNSPSQSWSAGGTGAFDNWSVRFRNVGSSPHNFYAQGTATNGAATVSRLMSYGQRSNPNRPGGPNTSIPSYLTVAQVNALAIGQGGTYWAPWIQKQRADPGTYGFAFGAGWVYPCLSRLDHTIPGVYGSTALNSGRRYPSFNTIRGAVVPAPPTFPAVSITSGEPQLTVDPTPWQTAPSFPAVTLTTVQSLHPTPFQASPSFPAVDITVADPPVVTDPFQTTPSFPAVSLSTDNPPVLVDPFQTVPSFPAVTLSQSLITDFTGHPAILQLRLVPGDVLSDAPPLAASGAANTDPMSSAGGA